MKERHTPVCLLLILFFTLSYSIVPIVSLEVPDSAATKGSSFHTVNARVYNTLELSHSTLLDGSLREPGGFTLAEIQWNKISGPDSYSIDKPSNKKTSVSNFVEGNYTFELLVIDDHNFRDKDVLNLLHKPQKRIPLIFIRAYDYIS